MGWYPGIINTTSSSGGGCPDLMLLMTTNSQFDLTDEDIQTQATKIPQRMFYGNYVRNISMSNITEVGDETFRGNAYLNNINLSSCTKIGGNCFAYSGNDTEHIQLKTINFPVLEYIGDDGFRGFDFNTSSSQRINLSFPSFIQGGARWFHGHNHVNYVDTFDLPSVEQLGYAVFMNTDMEILKLGSNCTNLGGEVFSGGRIGTIYCEATTPPSLGSQGFGKTSGVTIMPDHIYVPSGSITSYTTATNWTTYSNVISAIPTDFE